MSTCKKCQELLGKYAVVPQFNCHDCWNIITFNTKQLEAEVQELSRHLKIAASVIVENHSDPLNTSMTRNWWLKEVEQLLEKLKSKDEE